MIRSWRPTAALLLLLLTPLPSPNWSHPFCSSQLQGAGLKADNSTPIDYAGRLYLSLNSQTDQIAVTPPLQQLLNLTQVTFDGTAKGLVQATQATWLRAAGKARWEIEEIVTDNRQLFIESFQRLGMLESIAPQADHYDYVLVLGATVGAMKGRLAFFLTHYARGLTSDETALLVGRRMLDVHLESESAIMMPHPLLPWNYPTGCPPSNEIEAAEWLAQSITWPENLRRDFLILPTYPPKGSQSVTGADCFKEMRRYLISQRKSIKSILIISSQPHVYYQWTQAKRYLSDLATIDPSGFDCPETTKISVMLDALARWIYTDLADKPTLE